MEGESRTTIGQNIVIAQIHPRFLGISEMFIHRMIAGIKRYIPVVVTEQAVNENIYEFGRHYQVQEISSPKRLAYRVFAKGIRIVSPSMSDYTAKHAAFSHILQRERVKIIHAHFGHVGWFCAPLKQLHQMPLVVSFHGADASAFPKDPVWRSRYELLFDKANYITAPSFFIANLLEKIGCDSSKIRIIRYGIDLDEWPLKSPAHQISNDSEVSSNFKILMIARLAEKKGIPFGLQAIAKLSREYPNIQMRIVGEGPLRDEIENLIVSLKLSDKVMLLGSKPNKEVARLLRESDVLIMPSVTASDGETEGLPVSIIEASATGLPVVATYHAGIPEIIEDGETGFLVAERDVDHLAERLKMLLRNADLRISMGLAGRRKVEKEYSIERSVCILEEIYSEMLTSAKAHVNL